jgi:protein-tyrosine phosphatase
MIDVHCHILPGVDDGVQDELEAIEILWDLKGLGFSKIVFTPHINSRRSMADIEALPGIFNDFKGKLEEHEIGLEYFLGSEIMLDLWVLDTEPINPLVFRLGSKTYQLIEIPPLLHPKAIESYSTYARKNGITPIMAHVERLDKFADDKYFQKFIREAGFLFQVDILNFARTRSGIFSENAKKLLRDDSIDIMATDCHSRQSLPFIKEGMNYIQSQAKDWKSLFTLEK